MNKELSFLDLLSIASFVIALQNLELNITQDDFQKMMQDIDEKTTNLLTEIHAHLEMQDKRIDDILKKLEEDR